LSLLEPDTSIRNSLWSGAPEEVRDDARIRGFLSPCRFFFSPSVLI
jgi:hypothetical protein